MEFILRDINGDYISLCDCEELIGIEFVEKYFSHGEPVENKIEKFLTSLEARQLGKALLLFAELQDAI